MATGNRCRVLCYAGAMGILLSMPLGAAELQRPYDPVVLQGQSLPLLLGSPVAEVRVYSYQASTGQWLPVPFQIDERDAVNTYFAPAYNGLLDSLDELVFMASDAGDLSPEDHWVNDAEARGNVRYLITLADTLDGVRQGYLYVYRSSTLPASPAQYMSYNPASDLVTGVSYTMQHGSKGFADYLAINAAAGGDGLDFLDRQKFRLKVSVYGFGIDPFTEDHPWLSLRRVDYRAGGLRVTRSQVLLFSGSVMGVSFTDSLKLVTIYYPHFSYMSTGERSLVSIPNVGLRMLRFSYDLNSRAYGMIFYNPFNQAGNRINAIEAAGFNATLVWPGFNWYLIVADPSYPESKLTKASIVSALVLGGNPISDRYRLFFRDSASPEDPNTGDDGSYGETGIILEDNDTMAGTLNLTYFSYYLPANLTYEQAEQLSKQARATLRVSASEEAYDTTPPARIADLRVSEVLENSLTLNLTAPGDDGWLGGAASAYEIRYSTVAVGSDTTAWWEGATPLSDPPTPAEPGTVQSTIVTGLQASTSYYFVVVAVDNVGNRSAYSNVASATTLAPPDTIAPARISDLGVVDVQDDFVSLSLTAPGDDGWLGGPAASYEVAYATAPVGSDTAAWWQAASYLPAPPVPVPPGQQQTITVTSLEKNTTYHFVVVALDEAGNRSSYSNVATATTLPVELTSFVARADEGRVVLEWQTRTESNNYGFEVQRREGAEQAWVTLGFVRGAGTTTRPQRYRFVDQQVLARTYSYCLKQIDTDGRSEYSPAIEVTVQPPSSSALLGNYPNPFNPGTEIAYRIAKSSEGEQVRVRLIVYNLLGQEMITLVSGEQHPGWYSVIWDGRDALGRPVVSGLYICRLQAGSFVSSRKMLKMQ
ncbi:MAG: fibronectin type III domain-containing protein [Candidatus Oleimicrobiaceae bacterium]